MNTAALKILKMVAKRGELSLAVAVGMAPRRHRDHLDQYPLGGWPSYFDLAGRVAQPSALLSSPVSTEGAPSLRSLQGRVAMLPMCLMSNSAASRQDPMVPSDCCPPFAKSTRRMGHPPRGSIGKIKSPDA
jgi:hypothetical protein